jgi:hypothetical protein
LHNVFIEVQEGKSGYAAEVKRSLSGLQLNAGILIAPNLVANGNRAILRRSGPVISSARLKRYVPVQIADARDARWRVAYIASSLGGGKKEQTGQTEKQAESVLGGSINAHKPLSFFGLQPVICRGGAARFPQKFRPELVAPTKYNPERRKKLLPRPRPGELVLNLLDFSALCVYKSATATHRDTAPCSVITFKKVLATTPDNTLAFMRIMLELVFFPHGAQKMRGGFGGYGFHGTMQFFTSQLHIPAVLAFLAICAEFFGSLG